MMAPTALVSHGADAIPAPARTTLSANAPMALLATPCAKRRAADIRIPLGWVRSAHSKQENA